jgi:hypothetical protein
MPRISEFYGVQVYMYYGDHPPPHFHARYGQDWAAFCILRGQALRGRLPPRAQRLVRQWWRLHRAELMHNWLLVQRNHEPMRIAPLA